MNASPRPVRESSARGEGHDEGGIELKSVITLRGMLNLVDTLMAAPGGSVVMGHTICPARRAR